MVIINLSLSKCVITDLLYLRKKIYVTDSFTWLVFFCCGLSSARNCCIRLGDICSSSNNNNNNNNAFIF